MKFGLTHIILTAFICICFSCKSELKKENLANVNFCNYISVDIYQTNNEGKNRVSISPKFIDKKDKLSNFFKNNLRFDYLMWQALNSSGAMLFYPDTTKMKAAFCKQLQSPVFHQQIQALTNLQANANRDMSNQFSVKEMMTVASRFIFCDQVNPKDSSIGYHICVSINGMKELKMPRDYTVLAAFCIEAIFYNLDNNSKAFYAVINQHVNAASAKARKAFISADNYLSVIKQSTYTAMENDAEFQRMLLKYYSDNKGNFGIVIQ